MLGKSVIFLIGLTECVIKGNGLAQYWDRPQCIEPKGIFLKPENLMEFTLLGFRLSWDPWSFHSFHFFPFRNGNVYPVPASLLYSANTNLAWFHRFMEEEFCPRLNHTPSLTHIWFRWYLDEILDLELMLEWIKTFGDVGMKWIYFACEKDRH